jgi:DNA topoisomerase-1
VQHETAHTDRRIARIVRRMQELPGEELFQYVDEGGEIRSIGSQDVNAYLREAAGEEFTSKDFRTWAGTVLAARALHALGPPSAPGEAKRNVVAAIDAVSRMLGNTRAVCRKCYIHPLVLDKYVEGSLCAAMKRRMPERAVLRLLTANPSPKGVRHESHRYRHRRGSTFRNVPAALRAELR